MELNAAVAGAGLVEPERRRTAGLLGADVIAEVGGVCRDVVKGQQAGDIQRVAVDKRKSSQGGEALECGILQHERGFVALRVEMERQQQR